MLTKLRMFIFVVAIAAFVGVISVDAQRARKTVWTVTAEPAALGIEAQGFTIQQCKNGPTSAPTGCNTESVDDPGWGRGAAHDKNSHWFENDFVPYRLMMNDMVTGATEHTLIIKYNVFKGTAHALDYLGSFNSTEEDADPCVGVAGTHCVDTNGGTPGFGAQDTIAITKETLAGLEVPNNKQIMGQFLSIWGGQFVPGSFQYVGFVGGEERLVQVKFTASVSNPVIAWGGHIAWQGHWGAGQSAGNISGKPYHMQIETLDGKGGNVDLQLDANSVAIPAILNIVKVANELPTDNEDFYLFKFTSTGTDGLLFDPDGDGNNNFEIQGSGEASMANGIQIPADSNAAITITELQPPAGWSFESLVCTNGTPAAAATDPTVVYSDPTLGFGDSSLSPVANLTLFDASIVTCTFTNAQQIVTAAPAYVAGRVTDRYGRGISGARVSVYDIGTGANVSVLTNTFGYYKINDLAVGDFYVMSVSHNRYTFMTGSTSFTLDDNLDGMNFRAN